MKIVLKGVHKLSMPHSAAVVDGLFQFPIGLSRPLSGLRMLLKLAVSAAWTLLFSVLYKWVNLLSLP